MAKVSKYQQMVGQEVREGVRISNYRRLVRISTKSGKSYYRYELELNEVLWVSTTSFNKGSYGKRLAKAMGQTKGEAPKARKTPVNGYKTHSKVKPKYELVVTSLIATEFGWLTKEDYEKVKASGRATREIQREKELKQAMEKRTYSSPKRTSSRAYAYKKGIKQFFENITNLDDFENVVPIGNIMIKDKEARFGTNRYGAFFENPQELIDFRNRQARKLWSSNSFIDEELKTVYWNEWRTEFKRKYEEWVHENWESIIRLTKERIEKLVEEEEEIFGKSCLFIVKPKANKFDKMFNDLNSIEIKRLHKRLAKQYHPDLNPNANGTEFKLLQEAYERAMSRVA